jgi:hypothetical protein
MDRMTGSMQDVETKANLFLVFIILLPSCYPVERISDSIQVAVDQLVYGSGESIIRHRG